MIVVEIDKPSFYSYQYVEEEAASPFIVKGLREPLRQSFLDLMQQSRAQFGGFAFFSFHLAESSSDTYQQVINILEYKLKDSWGDLCNFLTNLTAISPDIKSIHISLLTPRSDQFYLSFIPKEYIEHEGRIPYSVLLQTQFSNAANSMGKFVTEQLSQCLAGTGFKVTVNPDYSIDLIR